MIRRRKPKYFQLKICQTLDYIHGPAMDTNNTPHTVTPLEGHVHTVIFPHGCASNAIEFAEEVAESQASDDCPARDLSNLQIGLRISRLRISPRFETGVEQWFDMRSVENSGEHKELQVDGLMESIALILNIIWIEASSNQLHTGIHLITTGGNGPALLVASLIRDTMERVDFCWVNHRKYLHYTTNSVRDYTSKDRFDPYELILSE